MKKHIFTDSDCSIQKKCKFLFLAIYDEYALGLRILSRLLINAGYEVQLLVFKKFSLGTRNEPSESEWRLLEQTIKKYNPDFIGISMLSIHVIDEVKLFSIAKNSAPDAILVCGGFGPTFEPARFLNYGAEFVVRGEGEGAILDMAAALEKGNSFKEIKNLAWLEADTVVQNPLRPQIDLAELPQAIHGKKYINYIDDDTIRNLDPMLDLRGIYLTSTSRGCTSRCTYCAGGNWLDLYRDEHGKCHRYRKRPIENIIEECETAKKLGATYISFLDEFFVRPEDEYIQYFQEYRRRVNLPFGLMVHTAFMEKDEARFEAFVKAGVHDVEIGVQSASPHVAKNIFHRPISLDTQLQTIQKLYDHWVNTAIDFITGHSLESEQDFLETVNFVGKLPFYPAWPMRCHLEIFSLGLLPGAKIGELYPELQNDPMTAEEKEFRQRILYIRHILKDNDEFWEIYNNQFLRRKPFLLKDVFSFIFSRLNAEFWKNTLSRLNGQEVYFFGAGQTYQMYKYLFRNTKPKGIIIDQGESPCHIDGLPILGLDEALCNLQECKPIILFSTSPGIMATKILNQYPIFHDFIPCCNVQYRQLFLK